MLKRINFLIVFVLLLNSIVLKAEESSDLLYAIENPHKVDSLDLSFQNIPQTVPWEKLSHLISLKLNYCRLRSLPDGINVLKDLKNLELDGNIFNDLLAEFDIITSLNKLRSLSLNNCYLFYLPRSINQLQFLENLELQNNYLEEVSWSLRKLRLLKSLDVSKNQLDTIQLEFLSLKQLERLNLSYNPNIEEKIACQIVSALPSMKEFIAEGWDTIPSELGMIRQIKTLNISNGSFVTLPEEIKTMTELENLIIESRYINWSKLMESLSGSNSIKHLTMGGCGLSNFPFNAFKLKNLEYLKIVDSKLIKIPSSFSRIKIKRLVFDNCFIEKPDKLFSALTGHKKLENILFEDCEFEKGSISIRSTAKLKDIEFRRCYLKRLKNIHFNGQNINVEIIHSSVNQKQFENWTLSNVSSQFNWKNPSKIEHKEQLKIPELNTQKRMRRVTVYGEVGLILDAGNAITIDIPSDAFIDENNQVVHGEIDVQYHIVENALDAVFSGLEMQTTTDGTSFQQVIPQFVIKIKAYAENEELKINPNKEILITLYNDFNHYQLFYYHPSKGLMAIEKSLETDTLSCVNNLFELNDVIIKQWSNKPLMLNDLRKSKVYLKLKKARKNRNFYYYLEPEYGFNEKYIPLLGNKIKAYPEFKPYRKIRWNYVGQTQDNDFHSMYDLSDQSPKRIKGKSSFYLYVMSLNDIDLHPSERGDFYEMTFYRGFDTLTLDVMPQIGITKPHKIQKWHRKKYLKYIELYSERTEKWHELDSIYDIRFKAYEIDLNNFRSAMIRNLKLEKGKNEIEAQSFSINSSDYFMVGRFSNFPEDLRAVNAVNTIENKSLELTHLYSIDLQGSRLIQTESNNIVIQPGKYTLVWSNIHPNKVAYCIVNKDFSGSLKMNTLIIDHLSYEEITKIIYEYVEAYR